MDSKGVMTQLAEVKGAGSVEITAYKDGYYLFLNPLADTNDPGNNDENSDKDTGLKENSSSGSDSDSEPVTTDPGSQVVQDRQKGYMTQNSGIITGKTGSMENDGYSHWILDEKGWWLRYADGSWAQGEDGNESWLAPGRK